MVNKLIVTEKEIIKKVADKFGYNELVIKRILYSMMDNLAVQTEKEDVYAIKIPYIGVLSFNCGMFLADRHRKEKNKGIPFSETKYIKYKQAERKYNAIEEQYRKIVEERSDNEFVTIPLHFKSKAINKFGQVGTNYRYQIEQHQNGWANNDPDYKTYLDPEPDFSKYSKNKNGNRSNTKQDTEIK